MFYAPITYVVRSDNLGVNSRASDRPYKNPSGDPLRIVRAIVQGSSKRLFKDRPRGNHNHQFYKPTKRLKQ